MEIFVQNVPYDVKERSLREFFQSHMQLAGVDDVFVVKRLYTRGLAALTFSEKHQGQKFLDRYGSDIGRHVAPRQQLHLGGRPIRVSRSRNEVNKIFVDTLKKEAKDRLALKKRSEAPGPTLPLGQRDLAFTSFSYGHWEYHKSELMFSAQETIKGPGLIRFERTVLLLESTPTDMRSQLSNREAVYRLEFLYRTIQALAWKAEGLPSITLTLSEAPKIYQRRSDPLGLDDILGLSKPSDPLWDRVAGLTEHQRKTGGSCLVYHFQLSADTRSTRFMNISGNFPKLPRHIPWHTVKVAASSFEAQTSRITAQIAKLYPHFGFLVRFQIQRLVQNGYLTPKQIASFLPAINEVMEKTPPHICAEGFRRMSRQIQYAGPANDAAEFEADVLAESLQRHIRISEQESFYDHDAIKKHPGRRLIHRAMVTPTGIYLEGPEIETINRVIRQYPEKSDHFLRVMFTDEDFDRLNFSRAVSTEAIVNQKFRSVLNDGIDISGRHFEYLGSSNSSLRTQSVWFMAPVRENGKVINARDVITSLGDFSEIRCPAKCAARIGQAFTDTSFTIKVDPSSVSVIPDIERNGRCFSDGVGTISTDMLERLWAAQPRVGQRKPTLYQIRYAGAKGMIALDSRLKGEVLGLRQSMIKFAGSNKTDLEVCGSSTRALPLFLNRQYIKLFEDLGVPENIFLELQDEAVESLQRVTQHALNASGFIEHTELSQATGASALIRNLYYNGFDFREDPFLRGILEIATLARLREMKYRSRILVADGAALYGIMDETGVLQEGQVYCSSSGRVIIGRVIVTRAPALHPGDVQMATAVDVPEASPLKSLDNCVIFSQDGERDLPSQLSGGDLDGDQYGIIWDKRLLLPRTHTAADYPRVEAKDIGRTVTKEDMTDFFLDYLGNDHLGRIAVLHVQLADSLGSDHPYCLKLAEMHSTAVDFAKTGVPVNMREGPRPTKGRPDFMAPSPRAIMENRAVQVAPEKPLNGIDSEESDDEGLDLSSRQHRYYESTRVLGKMYRAINERDFLDRLHAQAKDIEEQHRSEASLIQRLGKHIQRESAEVAWAHLRGWAEDLKERYEYHLMDTIDQYSMSPSETITEVEVFTGTILGREGAMTPRRVRDANQGMNEKFSHDVSMIVDSMRKGEDGEGEEGHGALAHGMACLAVALDQPRSLRLRKVQMRLESFAYIAAGVCLSELQKQRANKHAWRSSTALILPSRAPARLQGDSVM